MRLLGIRQLKAELTNILRTNASFAITRKGELIGVYLPMDVYRKLDPTAAIEIQNLASEVQEQVYRATSGKSRKVLKFEFLE